MNVKWRLYVDIYDIVTRNYLPSTDLASGTLTSEDAIKGLFEQINSVLPKDADYFKHAVTTLRTKSLTLESPLCFSTTDENQRHSPALVLEPDETGPSTTDLQALIMGYANGVL